MMGCGFEKKIPSCTRYSPNFEMQTATILFLLQESDNVKCPFHNNSQTAG